MRWNEDALYRQFLRRDIASNGKFLTGVLTTGIYCLPSCPARRPKRENVRFFRTPEEARESGLRPCYRCRPDFFYRGSEWHENLFEETVARARREPSAIPDVSALAKVAGLRRTALNDLFRDHAHETPAAFLRRVRVDHVCRLLREGEKPAHAAAAAGFESGSAFHSVFVSRTGLTPGAYVSLGETRHFTLRLPPAYRTREILDYVGRDPLAVSESVTPHGFRKCVSLDGLPCIIEVRFDGDLAFCETDAPNTWEAHRIVTRMMGFEADAAGFERQFRADALLTNLLTARRGLRIPLTASWWEALAWAIIGQQINLSFATTLRRSLIEAAGDLHGSGLRTHPAPDQVAALDVETLRRMKFSGSKAEYLLAAARAVANGGLAVPDSRGLSARRTARLLSQIRGVGPWTVEYVMLRGFGFADCLPAGDAGLAQGLEKLLGHRPDETAIRSAMARFTPHRSLATCHIWASLKGNEL